MDPVIRTFEIFSALRLPPRVPLTGKLQKKCQVKSSSIMPEHARFFTHIAIWPPTTSVLVKLNKEVFARAPLWPILMGHL